MRRQPFLAGFGVCVLAATIAMVSSSSPAIATGAVAISAGGGQSCALTADGGIRCWGANADGQLGDGTRINRNRPVSVDGLDGGAVDVATGLEHTCALLLDGRVNCWGQKGDGQLGDGTGHSSTIPVQVAALDDATALAAGYWHNCAVTVAGGLKCWGLNGAGQLGDGTATSRHAPVDVLDADGEPLAGVSAVATGVAHTCAVTEGGTAKCWGFDFSGQLGDDPSVMCGSSFYGPCSTEPVDVVDQSGSPVAGVAAVAAGMFHTCLLTTAGGVKCWGGNDMGQLGDGTTAASMYPVDALGLEGGVSAISITGVTTCALTGDGVIYCWGSNLSGQLGNGTTSGWDPNPVPVAVQGLSNGIAAVAAGGEHTCSLGSNNGIVCWGDNMFGELGDGTSGGVRTSPVDVLFDSDGDGCSDAAEEGSDPTTGGQRNPKNPWDYFNPTGDGQNRIDDVLAVVNHYFLTEGEPGYDDGKYDRSYVGPNEWNLGPPDGQVLVDDILHAVKHYGHDCGTGMVEPTPTATTPP